MMINAQLIKGDLPSVFERIDEKEYNKSDIRFSLRRQFPESIISTLDNQADKIYHSLSLENNNYNDAIIILTDLKNFSNLVSSADPNELNKLISIYYKNSRELVFKYGGVLDKFIGDAVLAIFNYPHLNEESYTNALKFSAEQILMGEKLLQDFQKKLDQEIETGTRVGLATGPIYALNIGNNDIEVTFLGEKMNFAVTLEKNCNLNGILMSNRFYHKLNSINSEYLESCELKEIKIDPKDAKGQNGTTTAWQVERSKLESIINISEFTADNLEFASFCKRSGLESILDRKLNLTSNREELISIVDKPYS